MYPSKNQPAQMYGQAKTHKFENMDQITTDKLKFRPIIAQTGTYTYKAAQIIAKYLKPLVSDNPYIINNTQQFPSMLKEQPPLQEDEEYVSYDVESLFTNVPVKDTIDYIIDQVYNKRKLPIIATKLIFTRLLEKLSKENTFMFDGKFYKQTDGCTMGGPLSVVFSNIFMTKLEQQVVVPLKPLFYRRYVDDSINRRKKNKPDVLFTALNNFKPEKIKFTIEVSPTKFLDTKIKYNETIETSVYRSEYKLPNHWKSRVPKRYKRNAINTDIHRAAKISSNFDNEKKLIKDKFQRAGFPPRFIDSVFRQYTEKYEDEVIIPQNFFDEQKEKNIKIEIPYCEKNEEISSKFLEKFKAFTNNRYNVSIKWNTKKVRNLFKLKSQNPHPSCKIYQGDCICGETYIGETERNVEVRWGEHTSSSGTSEPSKHLLNNPDHAFTWKILSPAPINKKERKSLEAFLIALNAPSLNNQTETKTLLLFRNGIT